MPIYYRLLYTSEHLQNWRKKHFHSYHHQSPGEWIKIWRETNSINPENYPLNTFDGCYTEAAREKFIEYSIQSEPSKWTQEQLKQTGELQGVCAFESPQDVFNYGKTVPEFVHSYYVEFDGEFLCRTPEFGGVVANVIIPLNIYDSIQFSERYNLSSQS